MARDIAEVRQEIVEMHGRLGTATHYELLGVAKEQAPEELKKAVTAAFRQLAKKWHVDRFSAYDLGEDKALLQQIFAALNTAQQVLSNDEKRTAYDSELAGEVGEDVGQIFDAENAFRRGKSMLNSGSNKGAYEQFKAALELNPEDREYRAHLLYAEFLLMPKNEEGFATQAKRAQEIFAELDEMAQKLKDRDWLLTFQGVVAMGLNQPTRAAQLLRDALQINRNNTVAQRQLRLIEMRKGKKQKKSFWDTILEKFKGR